MCERSPTASEEDVSKEVRRSVSEPLSLFQKCQEFSPDVGDPADVDFWIKNEVPPLEAKKLPNNDDSREPLSSECSSDSTRNYTFVNPQEFKCLDYDEEEPCVSPRFRPCGTFHPEEEEEGEEEEEPDVEGTLAIIKPEAVECRLEIEYRIFEEGFEVLQRRYLRLTPEQVADFYSARYGHPDFARLVSYMSSGPVVVLVLSKHQAVQDWRLIIGPTKVAEALLYHPDSIRARYGQKEEEEFRNAVHGSANREQAEREIHFFFPEFIVEPLPKEVAAADYLWEVLNPVLVEGLSLCCKTKPDDPISWLANWLLENDPNNPKIPEDLALVPT